MRSACSCNHRVISASLSISARPWLEDAVYVYLLLTLEVETEDCSVKEATGPNNQAYARRGVRTDKTKQKRKERKRKAMIVAQFCKRRKSLGQCRQPASSVAEYSNGVNKSLALLMDDSGIPKSSSYLRQGMHSVLHVCMYRLPLIRRCMIDALGCSTWALRQCHDRDDNTKTKNGPTSICGRRSREQNSSCQRRVSFLPPSLILEKTHFLCDGLAFATWT